MESKLKSNQINLKPSQIHNSISISIFSMLTLTLTPPLKIT